MNQAAVGSTADLSRTRTVTDFVAVFLDRTAGAMGPQSALREAAGAVRARPGGRDLAELVDGAGREGWATTVERLAEMGYQWGSPVLESLAAALRSTDCLRAPMQSYLLACAQAEATR